MGGVKQPMRYGRVQVQPDDAELIKAGLEILRKGAPKYWHRHNLTLAMYRLEKELVRVRGANPCRLISVPANQKKEESNEAHE